MSALLIKSLNLGIIDSALSWLIGALTTLFMWIVEFTIDLILMMLAEVLYELGLTLLTFVDFFQAFFNALCGMGTYWDSSGQKFVQKDPILSLVTNEAVLQVFLALCVVAVIMLFMTTLIAMVRTEFNSEGAKNTKGNILGQALKSLFMFFLVPAACVFGIVFSSALLNMVYIATSGGDNVTAGGMVWYASSYNANRLRNNSTLGLDTGVGNVSEEFVFTQFKKWGYLDDFGGRNSEDVELVANAIDNAFKSGTTKITNDVLAGVAWLDQAEFSIADAMNDTADGWHTKETGIEYSYRNLLITEVFYSIRDMNFIVLFLGGGIALYIMFIAAFGLIIRLYKCAVLFMISAPISALTPLDGGSTFKSWRKLMIGSVCSAFAVVIAFNLVFLLIPIMSEINIFNPNNPLFNSWNRLVNMLFVLTGLYTIKETSKWVASMLGIEDPLAAGSEIAGKVMGTVGKMGAMAGGAIAAGVGKRMAAKAGKQMDSDADALSAKMESVEAGVMQEKGYSKNEKGEIVGKNGKKLTKKQQASFDKAVSEAQDQDEGVKQARASLETSQARATRASNFHTKASGVWQGTLQKTMGSKLQKLDDFMGGTKLIGGYDDEGNITGAGGLAFKGVKGVVDHGLSRGARFGNVGRFDTQKYNEILGDQKTKYTSKTVYKKKKTGADGKDIVDDKGNAIYVDAKKGEAGAWAEKEYYADGKQITHDEYKAGRSGQAERRHAAAAFKGASIARYQSGGSRGSDTLASIHESEASFKRMVDLADRAGEEVANLIRTLTDGLKRMGQDAFKVDGSGNKGLSDAAYQQFGEKLLRLGQLSGSKLSVAEIATKLHDEGAGGATAKNLQAGVDGRTAELGKFYNANINMGGIKVEMMGSNLKEALQQVFAGMNIEGSSLEEQMSKVTADVKKEIEKQNAELKKQSDMVKKLAVAIAKYGKRLNPGK